MARNKYPEETEALILDVALILFLEKGYENTSIQDIIDGLGGLTKGAIYHHFKSKEEIMLSVINKIYENSESKMTSIINDNSFNGIQKLKNILYTSINASEQLQMVQTAVNFLNNPRLLVELIRSQFEFNVPNCILPIIKDGIYDGSIRTDYPKQLAEVIALLINLWLTPYVHFETYDDMINRFYYLKHILELQGIDILDDNIALRYKELCSVYEEKYNA